MSEFKLATGNKTYTFQDANGTVAFLTDIPTLANSAPMPEDFWISTSLQGFNSLGYSLRYKTDIYRSVDLRPYIPTLTSNLTEVMRNGNDLICIANNNASTNSSNPILVFTMLNCKIVNNVLTWDSIIYGNITVPARVHGVTLHRNFVYMATRPDVSTAGAVTQLVKVNPYNIADFKNFPSTILGTTTDIIGYKESVYCLLLNRGTPNNTISFIKIDENLNAYTTVFTYDTGVSLNPTRWIAGRFPFVIYNDEIYIVSARADYGDGTTRNRSYVGVQVYNFKGELVRHVDDVLIYPTESTTLANSYTPHWITIQNGKLIVSPTDITVSTGGLWRLLRFDTKTLALEESYQLPCSITDDNTQFRDGTIILNGEGNSPYSGVSCVSVKYNDFAGTFTTLIAPPFCSIGSINTAHLVQKEKNKINLSDFNNDLSITSFIPLAGTGTTNVVTGNVYFNDTAGPNGLNGTTNGYLKFSSGNVLIGSNPAANNVTTFKDHGIEIGSNVTDGIKGLSDFSPGYVGNSFVQKTYVDGLFATVGNGTVTSVTGANGVTVATGTTTPVIGLGAITPTSVAASGTVIGSNLSGTNTGDNATNSTSNTYADGKVQNSLTASTTLAPSVTAVNTALNLKVNKSGDTLSGTLNTLDLLPTTNNSNNLGSATLLYNSVFVNNVRSSIFRAVSSTNGILFNNTSGTSITKLFDSTGNVLIQNGGTFTDAGYKLDVQGTLRTTGEATVAPASVGTSAVTLSQLQALTYKGKGQSIQSGNGSITSFTITHGLSGITSVNNLIITPRSTAAFGYSNLTLSSTQITISYPVAPANSANLTWDWFIF